MNFIQVLGKVMKERICLVDGGKENSEIVDPTNERVSMAQDFPINI